MSDPCFTSEQIDEVLALPSDHPQRRHADTCPRCKTLLLEHRSFLAAEPVAGADIADAERQLGDFLNGMFDHAPKEKNGSGFNWRTIFRPLFARPALAAAVVVVIVAAAVWQPWQDSGDSPRVLRNGGGDTSGIELSPAVFSDGTVKLNWSAHADADEYLVRVYSEDLELVANLRTAATDVTVSVQELTDRAGGLMLWKVVALKNGDEIESSDPGHFEVP